MLRSMWSGVAGLRAHQTRMDVIGNDVANVNTVGYKQSEVAFKEQLVNTIRAPSPGTLGQQIGMGVQVGSISRNFTDGVLMETGQTSNVAVSGNGFFLVGDPGAAVPSFYSRAGDFVFTTNVGGTITNLTSGSGKMLWGYTAPAVAGVYAGAPIQLDIQSQGGGAKVESVAIAANGTVTVNYVGTATTGTYYIPLVMFNNNVGLKSEGSNLFTNSTLGAGPGVNYQAGAVGVGTLYQGYLENSNVDLAKEFTEMIITQRGFQANSRSITTGDEMLQELLTIKR